MNLSVPHTDLFGEISYVANYLSSTVDGDITAAGSFRKNLKGPAPSSGTKRIARPLSRSLRSTDCSHEEGRDMMWFLLFTACLAIAIGLSGAATLPIVKSLVISKLVNRG